MSFGLLEALALAGVIIMLFGAGKLPTVMGDLAKGVRSFKDEMARKDGERKDAGGDPP